MCPIFHSKNVKFIKFCSLSPYNCLQIKNILIAILQFTPSNPHMTLGADTTTFKSHATAGVQVTELRVKFSHVDSRESSVKGRKGWP